MLRTSWTPLGVKLNSEHIFAIGDVHGHANLLEQAFETIARTATDNLPRHLILLGDTIDRGPENLRTAQLVQNAKNLARVDKVSVLLGNHEIMLFQAIRYPDEHMMFWSTNGGSQVLNELDPEEHCYENHTLASLLKKGLPDYLTSDPLGRLSSVQVDELTFVHAGVSPIMPVQDFLSLKYDEELPGGLHWAWIRHPFLEWKGGWEAGAPMLIIHGHSPMTEALLRDTEEVESLAMLHESHKRINLDAGAGYTLAQISMGEFREGNYRIHIFQDEEFKKQGESSQ